jgi:hypothetical protein
MKSDRVKDHGHTYKFYLNNFLFDKAFKYDDGVKFWGNDGTNAEPLCVRLCNFVQCQPF